MSVLKCPKCELVVEILNMPEDLDIIAKCVSCDYEFPVKDGETTDKPAALVLIPKFRG